MLHALLHLHLDAALVLTDVERHLTQTAGDEFSEDDGQGCEQQQGPGQTGVEHAHEQEGATELYHRDGHLGHDVGKYGAHLLDVLGQTGGDVAGVKLLVAVELTAEQTAEDTEAQGVGLTHIGTDGQVIAHLSQDYPTHDGHHEQQHHTQHIVDSTRADGLVDEATAEPHHQQAKRHLTDACQNTEGHTQADAARLAPKPIYVFHLVLSMNRRCKGMK